MNVLCIFPVFVLMLLCSTLLKGKALASDKPRVIATTDGEIDDRCSMIRFLSYANEWDIKGLIYSSSKHHWKGDAEHPGKRWHNTAWIEEQIDKYAQVYSNLKKHDLGYPSPDYLKSQVFVGNIALEGDMREETPGSNIICEVTDNGTPPLTRYQRVIVEVSP